MTVSESLTYQDLVTPAELSEAVSAAGRYGGTIADHLLRLGFAGRRELLAVLGRMSGYPAVDLRKVTIDETVLTKVPARLAWKMQVLPITFDKSTDKLTLACVNPKDPLLRSGLNEQLPEYKITLCVTLETDLKCALMAHYRDAILDDRPEEPMSSTIRVSDEISEKMTWLSGSAAISDLPAIDLEESLWNNIESSLKTRILLLVPDELTVKTFANALRCDNCAVRTASDLESALKRCASNRFTHIFVHSSFSDMAVDVLLKFRDYAPGASVRFFSGISEFILSDQSNTPDEPSDEITRFGKTMPIPIGEANSKSRLLLLDPSGADSALLKEKLASNLFAVHTALTVRECASHFRQEGADIVLLRCHGSADQAAELVGELAALGYVMDKVPTYVITDVDVSTHLNWLLARGIEDIIPKDPEWQSLLIKLNRLRSRLEQEKEERIQVLHDLGTHGTLKDMNVIDLLQAMGPGDKTVRISVTGSGKQLTIFLDHGKLTYAACDEKTGAEAVYEGLAWKAGIWSVDPISRDDLPEPNNERTIDSILIEGCHLLDELNKAEFHPFG